jgi:hypothetical protein
MHFTFVDVQNSLTLDTASQIGQKLYAHRGTFASFSFISLSFSCSFSHVLLEQLFSNVFLPILDEPTLCFDTNAVVICWIPKIDCIQQSRLK